MSIESVLSNDQRSAHNRSAHDPLSMVNSLRESSKIILCNSDTRDGEEVTLAAYTVGGKGIVLREPFLANAINYRGKRIAGTPAFRNDLVYQPLNAF